MFLSIIGMFGMPKIPDGRTRTAGPWADTKILSPFCSSSSVSSHAEAEQEGNIHHPSAKEEAVAMESSNEKNSVSNRHHHDRSYYLQGKGQNRRDCGDLVHSFLVGPNAPLGHWVTAAAVSI